LWLQLSSCCFVCPVDLSSTALAYCNKGDPNRFVRMAQRAAAAAAGVPGAAAAAAAAGAAAAEAATEAGADEDHWQMIVARVPLGTQAVGRSGLTAPPEGFDSVNSGGAHVGGINNPGSLYCHVVFDNDQCYPEYVVTLKMFHCGFPF
jgi:hypothetical protein